jgi:MYXO-CTERM domain-containing protein
MGFPEYTVLTDHYSSLGVTFTDGIDLVVFDSGFLNDGVGLYGAIDSITVEFSAPMHVIAANFPGHIQFKLFRSGDLIYESDIVSGGFLGNFFGLISGEPFDEAVILDPTGAVYIDDLYFGPPIPAPPVGAMMVGAAAMACARRRRRPFA